MRGGYCVGFQWGRATSPTNAGGFADILEVNNGVGDGSLYRDYHNAGSPNEYSSKRCDAVVISGLPEQVVESGCFSEAPRFSSIAYANWGSLSDLSLGRSRYIGS